MLAFLSVIGLQDVLDSDLMAGRPGTAGHATSLRMIGIIPLSLGCPMLAVSTLGARQDVDIARRWNIGG